MKVIGTTGYPGTRWDGNYLVELEPEEMKMLVGGSEHSQLPIPVGTKIEIHRRVRRLGELEGHAEKFAAMSGKLRAFADLLQDQLPAVQQAALMDEPDKPQ